ncbi:STAG-domain-containing protein [Hyaloscypha variabilis F]|uniref:STAG-domain-containing protein n=1 Tax=Hyaloscypha variabilis (strain UAMH 11265 / GT02V1 / F) TaxID=1149755 RepID=A0A2J6RRS6_HYAVF|nr:STAG-domain-containing protein [Hyaloscypha variabilis F]
MTTRRTPLMDISNNDVTSTPVATGSRRKSGRAVKIPEKFVPNAPSSQQGSASAKRKRGGDDAENDASDVEEEEEESDATVESAAEEEVREIRRKAKTTKKPAAKKPKVNGAATHDEVPAVKLPARPKKTKKVAIADKGAGGLYADVYTSGESAEDIAGQWLARYNENNQEALTEFLNFIFRSAGCSAELTIHDINDPDNAENRISDMQDELQAQQVTDYPVISKSKSGHAFRTALVDFIQSLIKAMHTKEVLYTEVPLMENIHIWLSSLTDSSSRPFRHTATLVALTMASTLCKIASEEIDASAKVHRQLEGEKKNKRPNKARLADFQKKVDTNEKRKDYIELQLKDFFDEVYVHRYRDIDPRIRIECVEAIGYWILTLPSIFFEGQYLRYMGWMLSDTHAGMRQEVVKQLSKIMKNPSNHGQMRHFIERFRPRLVEMATRDSEPGVRAAAVELMDYIRQAGMLEPDDIDVIGKLIFDSEPRVRKSLVGFFAENIKDLYENRIEELGGEEVLEDILNVEDEEDFSTPRAAWIRYKSLAESLLSYDNEDLDEMPSQIEAAEYLNVAGTESRFTLAAQALYDKVPNLKDWEALAGYLLYDHSARATGNEIERALKDSIKPTEKEELILLEILNAVVKVGLESSDGSKKTKAEIQEAKENAARRLAGLIPSLLRKYGADPKTATVVLRLEHVLNLGIFEELRQDSTVYAKLLDEISAQFNGHADKGVLNEAGAALLHARGYEELEEVTEGKMQSLWDDTISALRKINKTGEVSVRGGFRNKVLTELSHNLARLEQLASISSPVDSLEADTGKGDPLPISIVLDVVARGVFEDSNDEAVDALEDEVVLAAIRSSMFYFMWKVKSLTDAINAGDEIPDLDIDHLKEFQDVFTTHLIAAFSSRSTLDPVRLVGAGALLDFHTLFSTIRPSKKSKAKNGAFEVVSNQNPHLESLVQEIGPEVQAELTSIFDALEKQFSKKSKKTLAEPSDDEAPQDLESEPEDGEDEDVTPNEKQAETLRAEQQLCELTGKLVLAILAQVIDVSGELKGKLRHRLQRNRSRLGPNFKEVIAYLDDPKGKGKKSHKSKAQQAEVAKKKAQKSTELVEEDEEEDDPFADIEPEEGTAEDLRRRELLDEEPEENEDAGEGPAGGGEEEDDDVLGD